MTALLASLALAVGLAASASTVVPASSLEVSVVDVTNASAPVTVRSTVVPVVPVVSSNDPANASAFALAMGASFQERAQRLLESRGEKVTYIASVQDDERGGSYIKENVYVGLVGEATDLGQGRFRVELADVTLKSLDTVKASEVSPVNIQLPNTSVYMASQTVRLDSGKDLVLHRTEGAKRYEYRLRYKTASL